MKKAPAGRGSRARVLNGTRHRPANARKEKRMPLTQEQRQGVHALVTSAQQSMSTIADMVGRAYAVVRDDEDFNAADDVADPTKTMVKLGRQKAEVRRSAEELMWAFADLSLLSDAVTAREKLDLDPRAGIRSILRAVCELP